MDALTLESNEEEDECVKWVYGQRSDRGKGAGGRVREGPRIWLAKLRVDDGGRRLRQLRTERRSTKPRDSRAVACPPRPADARMLGFSLRSITRPLFLNAPSTRQKTFPFLLEIRANEIFSQLLGHFYPTPTG